NTSLRPIAGAGLSGNQGPSKSGLRAVVAFDDNEVGGRMRQPPFDILLVFRRAIAGERSGVVREFDHDIARAALAFDAFELAAPNDKAAAKFLEDASVGRRIRLV